MGFRRKLREAIDRNNTLLCVGLDSEPSQMPPGISIVDFNRAIIESTCDLVCAYKPGEVYATGYTSAAGQVTLQLDPAPSSTGDLYVTVTKHDHEPYLGSA